MARPSAAAKPSRTTIRSLTPDPRNANKGSERGTGMLEHSLRQYGAGRSLLVDKHGVVIAGNKTLEAAASLGMDEIQIVQSDGTKLVVVQRTDLDLAKDAKAKELAVADNRVAQVSLDWDADVLRQLADEGADLSALFTKDELADLVDVEPVAGLTDPDDVPEPRATDIKPGDLFQLGRHRLLCGDCTDPSLVERLMDGARADVCFTSPPYGAGKVAKLRDHHVKGQKGQQNRESFYAEYADDPGAWLSLMAGWYEAVRPLVDVVLCNVQMLADNKRAMVEWAYSYRDDLCDVVVWDKHHGAPQMQPGVMTNVFEFIFILGGNGSRAIPHGSWHGTVQNIVRIDPRAEKNEYSDVHRAVMPVALPSWALQTLCTSAESVVDPFGGTGTTMIAAEQMGRRSFAMELSPIYVQVAIDRWEAFTGQKAQKVGEVALAS